MPKLSRVLLSTMLPALVAPAAAQDFLRTSAVTIPSGNFELAANPTLLFGRDGGPDRIGAAGRLGYGLTRSIDVGAQLGAFEDFSLIGLGAGFHVLRAPFDMLIGVGAHKALIDDARDTTAVDVSLQAAGRVSRGLDLSGGVSASFESLDGTTDAGFTRVYIGPGVRYRLSRSVDVQAQVGIGLNRHSPSYFSLGVSTYLPAGSAAVRREPR